MALANVIARALALCAVLLFAGAAGAQVPGYPDRPVKIIVPFAAAGPTDVWPACSRKSCRKSTATNSTSRT
jgi:tripartite-type tricarboxylate transporter receptor subunit TctC